MDYIYSGDIDGMCDIQYSEDAILISPFDFIKDSKPPHIIRGRKDLKVFFKEYISWHGKIDVESVYFFAETDNIIQFQAVFKSNTGKWVVGDGWYLEDEMIVFHSSFCYRVSFDK